MFRCHWLLVASVLLAACGSSSSGAQRPTIQAFVATPAQVIGDGGVVDLSWSVAGADRVSIAPAVGPVTPAAAGSVSTHVSASTTFTLTASGSGGDATGSVQCVDFSGLGSSDHDSLIAYCAQLGGQWGNSPCPAAGRVGTCQTPPLGPRTGISCSGTAIILERYYPPNYTAASAQSICGTVSGAIFTPG